MKRLVPVILLTFLVIASSVGCIKPDESPIYIESDDEPFELTMAVILFEPAHLYSAAKVYEKKTGIRINIENNFALPETVDRSSYNNPYPEWSSKYTEQTLASLMAGRGADIYDVRYLDFEQLGKNGLLVDMGGWLENDPELTDDKVFRDILLSGKTESGVFSTPIDISFRRLQASSADVPLMENKQMTWQGFFDEAGKLELTESRVYFEPELNVFMERFISGASDFIDEKGKTNNLDSEEMISLLEECKDWRDAGLCADTGNNTDLFADSYSYSGGGISSYRISEAFCTMPEGYQWRELFFMAPIPFDGDAVGAGGNGRYPAVDLENAIDRYGVNAGSPNAEAAQDFLRFLVSAEGQDAMVSKEAGDYNGFMLPLNRAEFRGVIERDLDRVQAGFKELELDIPALINEAEETIDRIAYFIILKPYYGSIIRETAKAFFLDEISAEEAAKQMSDKVGLYLKEQS